MTPIPGPPVGMYHPGTQRIDVELDACWVVAHEWAHHLAWVITPRNLDADDSEHVADCVAEFVGAPPPGQAPPGYGCTPQARDRARVLLQGRDPYPAPPPSFAGELHRVVRGGTVTVVPPAGYASCASVTVKGAAGLSVLCTGTGIRVAAAPDAAGGMRVVDVQDAAGWAWSVTVAVVEAA